MTAVKIAGTFKKDSRPDNGLEAVAAELIKDPLSPRLVVGIVVPHAYSGAAGEELIPTVRFAAIEVVTGDAAVTVRELIDARRAERNRQPVQESLPYDDDEDHDQGDEDDETSSRAGTDPYAGDGFLR